MGEEEKECCEGSKFSEFSEVFNSAAKFRIYGMLAMFSELSLTELSQRLGKSKSTIWDHLQRMIEIGMVEEREGKQVRSNIKPKIYSLTAEASDSGLAVVTKEGVSDEEYYYAQIENFNAFIDTQMSVLETWKRYNQRLQKKIKNGQIVEVKEEFDNKFRKSTKLSTATFYTEDEAKEFRDESFKLYLEIEKKRENNPKFSELPKPYFGMFLLVPFKYLLNFLNPPKKK